MSKFLDKDPQLKAFKKLPLPTSDIHRETVNKKDLAEFCKHLGDAHVQVEVMTTTIVLFS